MAAMAATPITSENTLANAPSSSVHPTQSLEPRVGISVFTNTAPGFTGVLKHRYSDFIVHEVGSDGALTKLTDLSPDAVETRYFAQPEHSMDKEDAMDGCKSTLLNEGISNEDVEKILEYVQGPVLPGSEHFFPAQDCKSWRTRIHACFSKYVPKIDTETVSSGELRQIRLRPKPLKPNHRSARWSVDIPNFLKFVVYKENVDTMTAVSVLAKRLQANQDNIGYAGTKDKRGITTQYCTMYRRRPRDVARMNTYQSPMIRVGNFSYVSEGLRLGDLKGNRFDVVLRDVTAPHTDLAAACEALAESGFVNYFGLQRFGKTGNTHQIGALMMQRKWDEIVDLLLTPSDADNDDTRAALEMYRSTGDAKQAVQHMHSRDFIPVRLLNKLAITSNREQAFQNIPKNMRLMYVHGLQSYVWNKAVSYRISTYGMAPVVGDLVFVEEIKKNKHPNPDEDEVGEIAVEDDLMFRGKVPDGYKVAHVTEEDVAARRFDISDVVIPLLGSQIQLPRNSVADMLKQLLREYKLNMDTFKDSKNTIYRMSGTYRRMIVKPSDFVWSVKSYTDNTERIIASDLDELECKPADIQLEDAAEPTALKTEQPSTVTDTQDVKCALCVGFTLPSSAYATMLIRELTKHPSDAHMLDGADSAANVNPHVGEGEDEGQGMKRKLEEASADARDAQQAGEGDASQPNRSVRLKTEE